MHITIIQEEVRNWMIMQILHKNNWKVGHI